MMSAESFTTKGPVRRLRDAAGWRVMGMLSMVRSVWRLQGWVRPQKVAITIADTDRLPVVFCTWNRVERLPSTLQMLAEQDVAVQAMIWDNSEQPDLVDKAVADACIPVTVHHSTRNIGGFGRFYLAQAAAEAGHEAVVFVDDDQKFGPEFVRELLSTHRPGSMSSCWAFRFTGDGYETRERCGPGEAADYLGTGGMVADTRVFVDARLFDCPRRYWFVEDLWLCYIARRFHGYALIGNGARLDEVLDGRNQSLALRWVKDRLRRYMARHMTDHRAA